MHGMKLLLAVAAVLFLAGCQNMSFYTGGGHVAEEERIALVSGEHNGSWQARDLSVKYRFSRNQSRMNIEGTIYFADLLRDNFTLLHDFHLAAILIDDQGKVLDTHGLISSARDDLTPLFFKTRVELPPNTVSMAFSYQGTALGGDHDGGNSAYFWKYPIR
jgi:hypothetical protein